MTQQSLTPEARLRTESWYAISERQLEQLATCLRIMDRARNRLAAVESTTADITEDLTKCIHSLYELTSHVRGQPLDAG
jgi:hypothetical protein